MEGKGIKRRKLEEVEEDRLSALPESLIHHILSFLPSTKQSIRTGILSKRWQNQWTRVPVLIFDSTGKSDKNFSQFIDRTLTQHDCSKIEKFHIKYDCDLEGDPQLTSKIRFAIRKNVEELILHHFPQDQFANIPYVLPKIVYNNASLLKLELLRCSFVPDAGRVNWSRLKELKLECYFIQHSDFENIVSGCPLLESLELSWICGFHSVVINSKSLKRLIFVDCTHEFHGGKLEILCPNLRELSITLSMDFISWSSRSELLGQTIENVLSGSPSLHTLELSDCGCSDRLVIASKSLKKLVLGKMYRTSDFEISCPDLEELNLYRFDPSVLSSFGGFDSDSPQERCLAMKILGQAQHVKLLEIGSWFIKVLSAMEMEGLSSPILTCKCLTLDGTNFDEHLPGIIRTIRNSAMLEKLDLKLQLDESQKLQDVNDRKKKNHWNSNGTVFNCPVSTLKTVKITGLSEENDKQKLVFKLVEFLLENAKMLEKIVVVLADCETGFLFEVSKKLLSFPRCSPHTIVELMCST